MKINGAQPQVQLYGPNISAGKKPSVSVHTYIHINKDVKELSRAKLCPDEPGLNRVTDICTPVPSHKLSYCFGFMLRDFIYDKDEAYSKENLSGASN